MKNITMKSTQLIEDSYTNYHHSIYLYIYYRIGNKEEAEDLAQDVYVRLMDYNRIYAWKLLSILFLPLPVI